MTLRIYRESTPGAIVFVLSGDMDLEHTDRLKEVLAHEADGHVTLDLRNVTLVDRAAMRFLAEAESAGTRIVNCPGYVRRWIVAEKEGQTTE